MLIAKSNTCYDSSICVSTKTPSYLITSTVKAYVVIILIKSALLKFPIPVLKKCAEKLTQIFSITLYPFYVYSSEGVQNHVSDLFIFKTAVASRACRHELVPVIKCCYKLPRKLFGVACI